MPYSLLDSSAELGLFLGPLPIGAKRTFMSPDLSFEQRKRAIARKFGEGSNAIGALQSLNTLLPLVLLWVLALWSFSRHPWLCLLAAVGITMFLVRVFSLLHECGHGALFRSRRLNAALGFVFGVISGMPQYVWSQHHDFHHRTNGNWERYRGPLTTMTVRDFAAMPEQGQRRYRLARQLWLAPLGGFVYLIFNPRFNWLKGNLALLLHLARGRPFADFSTRYWKTWKEYRHMSGNNLVLLSIIALMCINFGAARFFTLYLIPLSISGGIGIMLFTVQHNFEHAYATDTAHWDIDQGALKGTSFLVLPGWLNWFTAHIGYHHVHHMSAAIPNYRLVQCHRENADLFESVPRLRLKDVPRALRCLLWDEKAERIISFEEFELLRT